MKGFNHLPYLIIKARRSQLWLYILNFLMARVVPFNSPHKFHIVEIGVDKILTCAPYRRSNYNHIRGVHACAIATIAEFSAGFLLLTKLDPTKYRLIMSKLEVDYFYQAKEKIFAEAKMSDQRLQQEVVLPLQDRESISIVMKTFVRDNSGNDVATGHTSWQIKRWDKVKTKV